MSNEKCFCHFNGYAVKDATARKLIEQNAANIVKAMQEAQNVKVYADNIKGEIELGGFIASLKEVNHGRKLTFWVGTQEEYDLLTELREECFYIVTDDNTLEKITAAVEEIKNGLSELAAAVEENKTLISALTAAVEENKNNILNFARESEEKKSCFYRMAGNEKEWINPPLATGVEYRTIERDGNRPVYVKKLEFATAGIGAAVEVDIFDSEYAQEFALVSITGKMHDAYTDREHQFPVIEMSDGAVSGILTVDTRVDDNDRTFWFIRQHTYSQLADHGHARVIVKYTKD